MNKVNFDEKNFIFKSAFEADTEIQKYKPNDLSIFALSLYLRLDDIDEFAADAITEGGDDKKADICYIDLPEKRAIIAQSYVSQTWGKRDAPANKASDLNTAIAWLLSASESNIPENLRNKAIELRRAIASGEINRLEILYIHNCFESENVENELKTVAGSARDSANSLIMRDETSLVVSHKEYGLKEIEELYRSRDSEILIEDWIEVPIDEGKYIGENGLEWNAILTTVPGEWIKDLYKTHRDRLFSANFRDYMGMTNRKRNINFGIKQTAENEPVNFWVYNNGITALTHEIKFDEKIRIRGISIINGAQTSGALSDASDPNGASAKVLIRIVQCKSKELIDKIIRYNNTQNEIKPADRRSNDKIQNRLKADFSAYEINYVPRRSATRTPKNAVTSAAIGAALCAFHGDPQTSYRDPTSIFNDDNTYERVFADRLTVEHAFLLRSLSSAMDIFKSSLKNKVGSKTATQLEEQQYDILKYSFFKHFLFYVIGFISEEIMKSRISDLYQWKSKIELISPDNTSLTKSWTEVLNALLPQMSALMEDFGRDAAYEVPRSMEKSKEFAKQLKVLIAAKERLLGEQFKELRKRTTV